MSKRLDGIAIFGLFFTLIGVGLLLGSLLSDRWIEVSETGYHSGLLRFCFASNCTNIGWTYEGTGLTVLIMRSTALLACIFVCFGLALGTAFRKISSAGLSFTFAGLATLVGCACYTTMSLLRDYKNGPLIQFGYSFYLGWASGGVLLIAGIITNNGKIIERNDDDSDTEMMQVAWTKSKSYSQPKSYQITEEGQQVATTLA